MWLDFVALTSPSKDKTVLLAPSETPYLWLLESLRTYWHFKKATKYSRIEKHLTRWTKAISWDLVSHHIILSSALELCYLRYAEDDISWDLSCFHWKIQSCWFLMSFLELNCRRLNVIFLKLKQPLIVGDIESNTDLTQNDCKSPGG